MKILVIGGKGCGKSTICLRLTSCKHRVPNCEKETQGQCLHPFNNYNRRFQRDEVKFCEIGGLSHPDQIPEYFYSRLHGVIYVVDVSRPEQLVESRKLLDNLMSHEFVRGKPFLILANKSDKLSSREVRYIRRNFSKILNLKELTMRNKTMTLTKLVSAISLKKTKDLYDAATWLVEEIKNNYYDLQERVGVEVSKYEQLAASLVEHEVTNYTLNYTFHAVYFNYGNEIDEFSYFNAES